MCDVVVRLTTSVCTYLCVCVCVSGNYIEAAGGTAVAEALEVNTTVQKMNLEGECSDGYMWY